MKNSEKDVITIKFWIILIVICIFFIGLIAVGFYIFSNRKEEVIEKKEEGAKIYLNYTNNSPSFILNNLVPTTDSVGIKSEVNYYDFSVEGEVLNANEIEYEISIIKDLKLSNVSDDEIRIYLEKEDSGTYIKKFGPENYTSLKKDSELGSEKGSMVLWKDSMKNSEIHNYRLKIWLSDKSLLTNGTYKIDVIVNGESK